MREHLKKIEAIIIVLSIIFLLSLTVFDNKITGLITLETNPQSSQTININQSFNATDTIQVNITSVNSLRLSGSFYTNANGTARIYNQDSNGTQLLIFDSESLISQNNLFNDICVDTCNAQISDSTLLIIIRGENTSLTVYNITYSTSVQPGIINALQIPDVNLTNSTILNLSQYFTETNNAPLTFTPQIPDGVRSVLLDDALFLSARNYGEFNATIIASNTVSNVSNSFKIFVEQNDLVSNTTPFATADFSTQPLNENGFSISTLSQACGILNESLTLTQNVGAGLLSVCFDFNTSGITLDCAGFNITGNGTGIAINISNSPFFLSLGNITVKDCNIQNFSIGINVSSAVNISLFNNNITNVTAGIWLNNTARSVLENNTVNNSINDGAGIGLINSSNNVLRRNTGHNTGGGSSLAIIYVESSQSNVLDKNSAFGVDNSGKIGIYINTGSNTNLTNNYGYNVFSFQGISLGSFSNSIMINNTGQSGGSGRGLESNGNNNKFINNTGISNSGNGLASSSVADSNEWTSNFGTSDSGLGMNAFFASNTNFTNNVFASNTSYGISLNTFTNINQFSNNTFYGRIGGYVNGVNNNNFTNNTLIGDTGFEINGSKNILIANSSFQGTNWSIKTNLGSNVSLIDNERMTNYSINNSPSFTITKTGIASINFFNIINANGTNLSMDVNLTTNKVHVNSSRSQGLNVTGNITIYNSSAQRIVVSYDPTSEECPSSLCSQPILVGRDLYFNVSHFTTFFGLGIITSCQILNESGNIANNIIASGGNCFDFNQSNILIDCLGSNITSNPQGSQAFNISIVNSAKLSNITLKNCNIQNFSIGINISSAANISLFNNNITNVTDGIWLNNTAMSVLENNSINVSSGAGIFLINSSNNTLYFNNASDSFGTSGYYQGIVIINSSNNNLNNNTGTSLKNIGVELIESRNNILKNNKGITNDLSGLVLTISSNNTLINNTGTSNVGHGIVIGISSDNNTLINNTGIACQSNSCAGTYGLSISGSYNNITSNTGIHRKESGYGIGTSNGNHNIFTNNVAGNSSSNGFDITLNENNTLLRNVLNGIIGLRIFGSENNTVRNNTIIGTSVAVLIDRNIVSPPFFNRHNILTNNTLIGDTGFEINGSSNISIINTSFQNVNWSIRTGLGSNVSLIDNERMTNYSINNSPSFTITKTGIASINFFNIINANGTNLSMDVNLTTNKVHVNSSRSSGLNVTGNITLFNSNFAKIQVAFDDSNFVNCTSDICSPITYSGANMQFNVSHFTTFQGGGAEVPISSCRLINESVVLVSNVSTASSVCFDFNQSNILFDCAGNNITSTTGTGTAINISRVNNAKLSGITIQNCNILNFSIGINISNAENISLFSNNISNSSQGILLRNTSNTIINNSIIHSSLWQGIFLINSSNNTITNNLVTSNRTQAIYLTSILYNNLIKNNIAISVESNGLELDSRGESNSGYNNTFINNTGMSTDNAGISLEQNINNSFINNTGISVNSQGIYLFSSINNTFLNNTGTSTTDAGLYLETVSNNLLISNAGNSSSNYGIIFDAQSENNSVINSTGTSVTSIGIYILSSSNNNLTGTVGSSTASTGLYFSGGSNKNIFINNTFKGNIPVFIDANNNNNNFTNTTVIGDTGFEINGSSNISIINTSFQNVNWSIKTNLGSNVSLIDNERMTNYSINNSPSFTITKTGIGSINFFNIINANGTNLSMDVNLTTNKVHVNSSRSSGFNVSANITLFGLADSVRSQQVMVDYFDAGVFEACPSIKCTVFGHLSGGTLIFNVSSFTSYQVVNGCGVINESTTLAQNILGSGGGCFDFNQSNLVFDCAGYNVTSNPAGVMAFNLTDTASWSLHNITIKNCNIQNFSMGINISSAANISLFNNNVTNVTDGVWLNNSVGNILDNNSISAGSFSIYASNSTNNTFTRNVFNSTLIAAFIQSSRINNFTNNTVIGNTGFEINNSKNVLITNSSFQSTTWSIRTGLGSNVSLIDNERMTNYSINNSPSFTITKTGIASIKFFNIINANGTNLSMDVNLTTNKTFVNTTKSSGLNVTANITIYNVLLTNPVILADFNDNGTFTACPLTTCNNISYAGNTFLFNTSHFTTFALNENLTEDVNITVNQTIAEITTGNVATYLVTIGNNGTRTSTYNLSINNLNSAQTATINQTIITLNKDATGTIILSVGDNRAGTYNVTIIVISAINQNVNSTTSFITTSVIPPSPQTGNSASFGGGVRIIPKPKIINTTAPVADLPAQIIPAFKPVKKENSTKNVIVPTQIIENKDIIRKPIEKIDVLQEKQVNLCELAPILLYGLLGILLINSFMYLILQNIKHRDYKKLKITNLALFLTAGFTTNLSNLLCNTTRALPYFILLGIVSVFAVNYVISLLIKRELPIFSSLSEAKNTGSSTSRYGKLFERISRIKTELNDFSDDFKVKENEFQNKTPVKFSTQMPDFTSITQSKTKRNKQDTGLQNIMRGMKSSIEKIDSSINSVDAVKSATKKFDCQLSSNEIVYTKPKPKRKDKLDEAFKRIKSLKKEIDNIKF